LSHRTQPFTVAEGDSRLDLDAGLSIQTPLTLGDRVWLDTNQDGIRDPSEPGLGGVLVRLEDAQGNVIATTTTMADGSWQFLGLQAGTYRLEFVAPPGYALTLRDQGTDETADSDADPLTGLTDFFSLTAQQPDHHNAGFRTA